MRIPPENNCNFARAVESWQARGELLTYKSRNYMFAAPFLRFDIEHDFVNYRARAGANK